MCKFFAGVALTLVLVFGCVMIADHIKQLSELRETWLGKDVKTKSGLVGYVSQVELDQNGPRIKVRTPSERRGEFTLEYFPWELEVVK